MSAIHPLKFTALILTLLSLTACVTTEFSKTHVSSPNQYQQAMTAWQQGNDKSAAELFKAAYEVDDPRAEAMLGVLYMKGVGVFQNAEVARAYAIAADQRGDFDAFQFYHQRWETQQDSDDAYLIAWVLANRFSGRARQDYEAWITRAAEHGHSEASWEVTRYLN